MTASSTTDLKNINPATSNFINLLGYYSRGDGGGGDFYWDASSTETPDDGIIFGSNIVMPTGRWKRIFDGPLHVKWYGATGSDTATAVAETTAIQAAINACSLGDYGEVFFQKTSDYYKYDLINIPSNIILSSDGAVLRPTGSTTNKGFWLNGVSNVKIKGFEFDGTDQLSGDISIILCEVSSHISISDCIFRDGRFGLFVKNSTDMVVENSLFIGFRAWGNYFEGVANLILSGNTAHHNTNDGFKFAGVDVPNAMTTIKDVIVTNNISYSNGQDGLDFAVNNMEYITISNNIFYDNTDYGITFKTIYQTSFANNLVIRDNILRNNIAGGVNTQFIAGSVPYNYRIHGNLITSTEVAIGAGAGLRLQDIAEYCYANDNDIDGYLYGIRLINSSNAEIYQNTCRNNSRNFHIDTQSGNSTSLRFYKNVCIGNATAFYLTNNIVNAYIHDNDLSKNTSTSFKIVISGTGSDYIAYNNYRGTASVTPTGRGIIGDYYINILTVTTSPYGWRATTTNAAATWTAF